MDKPMILPMPGNENFARELAFAGGGEVSAIETRRFPDGETYLRLLAPVKGRAVDVVATLAGPDPDFLRLAFAADAARAQGAARVRLVAPYLAYMRQDKAFKPGEAVTSDTFARLVSSLFDGLVTVDPHLHRRTALSELYTIPAAAVQAAPALADWIVANVDRPLLIGPDSESAQWVQAIAERISAPWRVMEKTRRGDYDVSVELPDLTGHAHLHPGPDRRYRLVRAHLDRGCGPSCRAGHGAAGLCRGPCAFRRRRLRAASGGLGACGVLR